MARGGVGGMEGKSGEASNGVGWEVVGISQAAIAAVRKAGQTGRARTGELKEVVGSEEEAGNTGIKCGLICLDQGTCRDLQ